jgi:hypothetical protein
MGYVIWVPASHISLDRAIHDVRQTLFQHHMNKIGETFFIH